MVMIFMNEIQGERKPNDRTLCQLSWVNRTFPRKSALSGVSAERKIFTPNATMRYR
jgi:hypothetical protein